MKHNMDLNQNVRFLRFMHMNDIQFYNTYIEPMTEDAQLDFLLETPDFLSEVIDEDAEINLETDSIFQKITKQIHNLK